MGILRESNNAQIGMRSALMPCAWLPNIAPTTIRKWEALASIATKIGCTAEKLRRWCLEEASPEHSWLAGTAAVAADEKVRIKALEREVKELCRANEILRKTSAYVEMAERA
ncbi:hypothetical protein [Novosphingobium sp. MBES04]|uniref:hypothetical protein n=1 Tax=Novosphingobium sp. MBES04 TaxID=1206458 RepID=UPI004040711F